MKKCYSEIMKMIKDLGVEKNRLIYEEREEDTTSYLSTEKPMASTYDFDKAQQAIEDIDAKVRHLKQVLAKGNATTKVIGYDITLNEALVYLAQLSSRLSMLEDMANRKELTRRSMGMDQVEFTKTNYDPKLVKVKADAVRNEINKLQMAIDKTNLTKEAEVD